MRMKPIFFIVILSLVASQGVLCQTKIIAHKSHSGKNITFIVDNSENNFGLRDPIIDSIRKIPNQSVVLYTDQGIDTIRNYQYWDLPLDSLKKYYGSHVKFIGFDKNYMPKKSNDSKVRRKKSHIGFFAMNTNYTNGNGLLVLYVSIFILLSSFFIWRTERKKMNASATLA